MLLTWISLIIQILIAYLFSGQPWFQPNLNRISWVIIAVVSAVFIIEVCSKYTKDKYYNKYSIMIILLGFFARIFFLWWERNYRHIFNLIHSGPDAYAFILYVYIALQVGHTDYFRSSEAMNYVYILFYLMQMVGLQRILAQFLNLLLGVSSIFIAFSAVKKLNISVTSANLMITLAMLMPNFMFLNVVLLREAFIVFFITISIYLFIVWFKKDSLFILILSFIALLGAAHFHRASIAVAGGYVVTYIFYDRKNNSFKPRPFSIVAATIMLVLYLIVNAVPGIAIFAAFQDLTIDHFIDFATETRPDLLGEAGYRAFIPLGNPYLEFVVNSPIRMLYLIFSPMPWYWRNMGDIIAFVLVSIPYMVFYFMTIRYLILNKKRSENKNLIIALLITSMFSIWVFSWGTRNAGTAMRHRDKFLMQHIIMLTLTLKTKEDFYFFLSMLHPKLKNLNRNTRFKIVKIEKSTGETT